MERRGEQSDLCANQSETLAYLEGSATPSDCERIEAHIAQCERCFHLIDSFATLAIKEDSSIDLQISEALSEETKTAARALFTERRSEQSTEGGTASEALPSKKKEDAAEPTLAQRLFEWFQGGRLVFALIAVALLLGAIIFSIFSKERFAGDENIAKGSKLLIEAASKERHILYRVTGMPHARFIKERGDSSKDEKLNAAYAVYNAAVAQNPTPEARHGLGRTLIAMGRWDDAAEALQKAASEAADDASILTDLAAAYGARGDDEKALEVLNRALESTPPPTEAIFNRALLYKKLKKYDEARQDLQIYLKVDSTSPWAEEARDYLKKLEMGDVSE